MTQYRVVHYERRGRSILQRWLDNLRDYRGRCAVQNAIDRMEDGNFGVHRFCRDGVWELVINTGPGYRVYYSVIADIVVLLLCAGDKKSQQQDIEKAIGYLQEFRKENE